MHVCTVMYIFIFLKINLLSLTLYAVFKNSTSSPVLASLYASSASIVLCILKGKLRIQFEKTTTAIISSVR